MTLNHHSISRNGYSRDDYSEVVEKRRKEILDYAEQFIRANGFAPPKNRILDVFSGITIATLDGDLRELANAGLIVPDYGPGRVANCQWTLPKFAAACRAVE